MRLKKVGYVFWIVGVAGETEAQIIVVAMILALDMAEVMLSSRMDAPCVWFLRNCYNILRMIFAKHPSEVSGSIAVSSL